MKSKLVIRYNDIEVWKTPSTLYKASTIWRVVRKRPDGFYELLGEARGSLSAAWDNYKGAQ